MKKVIIVFVILLTAFWSSEAVAQWKGKWISTAESQSVTNTWLAYRKVVDLSAQPSGQIVAKIAADSKYWLWINGELVVFEGGLKRGPNSSDTYFDEVHLEKYLQKGKNVIAVLTWYFGKDGFSHKSSGRAGLLFDCRADGVEIVSDNSWHCMLMKAFGTAGAPLPNFRMSESSIMFDARRYPDGWQSPSYTKSMPGAMIIGEAGEQPWNKLVKRPIPLFKDFGKEQYVEQKILKGVEKDTVVCTLPYNAQITPSMKIRAKAGQKIEIMTDNYLYFNGGDTGLRAEYITKDAEQEYESLGWINGHRVYYIVPKGVEIIELKYRETGYDTDLAGFFSCSDPFFNDLWQKAYRTLYITMRDNYMDCPERERAQWTGDAVNEMAESFYTQSSSSHLLAKKWLHELIGWQKTDGTIYAPVPAGNWLTELPGQSMASVGFYGLWYYYLYTGDRETVKELYSGVKRYFGTWKIKEDGTVQAPSTGWLWGDWGNNKDMALLYNFWYYLGVKGMLNMAQELGYEQDATAYSLLADELKNTFNQKFWNGTAYRDPAYTGETDDRVQALAVVSGVADKEKYPSLLNVLLTEKHSSPYMEKYVFEAMMRMGYYSQAMKRQKARFEKMVADPYFTTLFEGWGIGTDGYGGGTVNHAWSGGGLTVLSQYVCGVEPLKPGFELFGILPRPGELTRADIVVPTVKGDISSSFKVTSKRFEMECKVPYSTRAVIGVPIEGVKAVYVNKKAVWRNGKFISTHFKPCETIDTHVAVEVGSGKYTVEAVK